MPIPDEDSSADEETEVRQAVVQALRDQIIDELGAEMDRHPDWIVRSRVRGGTMEFYLEDPRGPSILKLLGVLVGFGILFALAGWVCSQIYQRYFVGFQRGADLIFVYRGLLIGIISVFLAWINKSSKPGEVWSRLPPDKRVKLVVGSLFVLAGVFAVGFVAQDGHGTIGILVYYLFSLLTLFKRRK